MEMVAGDLLRRAAAPRALHIYCDGGFGNRFNGLVSGLAIADMAGLEPRVIWPVNNWCGAPFESIFDVGFEAQRKEKREFAAEIEKYQLLMGWDDMQMGRKFDSPLCMKGSHELMSSLATSQQDVYYDCVVRPGWIGLDALFDQIQRLPFRPELVRRADQFIARHQLTDFFGLHIRKTDFGDESVDETGLRAIVSRAPDHRFFVCSDDAGVEESFAGLPNAFVNRKATHVRRMDTAGGWNTPVKDSSGRILPFNVLRDEASVQDAIVDLLILKRSKIVRTSHSTFLDVALLLQAYNFAAKRVETGIST